MSLKDKIKFIPRKKIVDERGWFLKVINGKEENLPKYTGEVYLTFATPKEIKGGHYHLLADEWFTLIQGVCKVELIDINTNEKMELITSEEEVITFYVPREVAHRFVNMSNKNGFLLLAYTNQLYSPEDTINYKF